MTSETRPRVLWSGGGSRDLLPTPRRFSSSNGTPSGNVYRDCMTACERELEATREARPPNAQGPKI
jgi:hypothetical protein